MGLDLYVGSLTRYYSGDWEMISKKVAREMGVPLQVIRPHTPDDAIRDPEVIRPTVEAWRSQLSEGLAKHLTRSLDWAEQAEAPYFTDKPTWDCYADLALWAAYSEHRELARPMAHVKDFGADPAFQLSTASAFNSRYSHLFDVEWWLPCDFNIVFKTEKVAGGAVMVGSSVALVRQLAELNAQTWGSDATNREQWLQRGSDHGAPLESGARFAFALIYDLANKSVQHHLPMLLDY